jgi:putative (di)nucleoside polyphosphate hydrolase
MKDLTGYTYRPAAGIMLINDRNQVWVGQRLDSTLEAWQMPQGISRDLVEIIARAPEELTYDLPEDLIGVVWKQKWRGQRQTWFLARFLGRDEDVNIQTPDPEFRAWRWAEADELPRLIVPFKKKLYEDVIAAFQPWLEKGE